MPRIWGPPTWSFLHTLVAKVKEEHFPTIRETLFAYIKQICFYLNCPSCSAHALSHFNSRHWRIKEKNDLIDFLFDFHNKVNESKQKQIQLRDILCTYEEKDLLATYASFLHVYKPAPPQALLKLLGERMRKKIEFLEEFDKWLNGNLSAFQV